MKVLIILEYEKRIQPFMLSEIQVAKDLFDTVYLITRKLNGVDLVNFSYINVEHIEIEEKFEISDYFKFLLYLFCEDCFNQLIEGFKKGKISISFLRYIGSYLFSSWKLNKASEAVIKSSLLNNSDVYMMATWFASEAYTIARFKKKYPKLIAFSLAHSFEIDPVKNPFVSFSFNDVKHKYLDCISFISKKMLDIYHEETKGKYIKNSDKIDITYLGCIKKYPDFNSYVTDEVFYLCSCSNIIHIKRIFTIIEILRNWTCCKVHWTHLGGGPLENTLRCLAKEVERFNDLVAINIVGKICNDDVHKYYVENQVDLFINVSEAEGLPVSIMEAIAYGIPVIATDVGGTCEIVNNSTGILVPKDASSEYIYKQIVGFHNKYRNNRFEIRKCAYEFYRSHFDAQKNVYNYFKNIVNINK